jgi:hypothetical protein
VKHVLGLVGAVILGIGLVGCGGGSRPPAPTTVPTTVASVAPSIAATQLPLPTSTDVSLAAASPTEMPSPTAEPPTMTPVPPTVVPTTTAIKTGIELPQSAAHVSLPVHILARIGVPGDKVTAELRWKDGTLLQRVLIVVAGEDGRGLIIDSLGWNTETQPPQPPTQAATLSLRAADGTVLLQQNQTVLADNDPTTREISLYWVGGDQVYLTKRRIPKTAQIGAATLDELLWGPSPWNLAGFTTALPSPDEVLHSPGRQSDWGPRVTLKKLTIVGGVATADFSKEMGAFSGGSARVTLLRQQITRTLQQFATVKDVKILVDGQSAGIIEP